MLSTLWFPSLNYQDSIIPCLWLLSLQGFFLSLGGEEAIWWRRETWADDPPFTSFPSLPYLIPFPSHPSGRRYAGGAEPDGMGWGRDEWGRGKDGERRPKRDGTERGEDGIEAGYGALGSRSSHLRYPPRFPATPRAVHTPHSLAVRLSCVPFLLSLCSLYITSLAPFTSLLSIRSVNGTSDGGDERTEGTSDVRGRGW